MNSLIFPWVLSGVSVAFLIGCVEYNRRTGFKRVRNAEAPLDEALLWIRGSRASLAPLATTRLQDIERAQESTRQLIQLYNAYHPKGAPAAATPGKTSGEASVEVPADVEGEYALVSARL